MRQRVRAAYFIGQQGAEREQMALGISWLGWSIVKHGAMEAWLVTPSQVSVRGVIQDVLGEAKVNGNRGCSGDFGSSAGVDRNLAGKRSCRWRNMTLYWHCAAIDSARKQKAQALVMRMDTMARQEKL